MAVPRHVVDEVASILARRYEESRTATISTSRRACGRTLRSGLFPELVFEPPCRTRPVIVLQDIGREMRPWTATVNRFLGDSSGKAFP